MSGQFHAPFGHPLTSVASYRTTKIIIISHVSKCIVAKFSGDLQSDEPGDAAQARTAGTIKGRR